MALQQVVFLLVGAFLTGIGATIIVLANVGRNETDPNLARDRLEGCLTFVFGTLPALLGVAFMLVAAVVPG